jgi:hypothetical protein
MSHQWEIMEVGSEFNLPGAWSRANWEGYSLRQCDRCGRIQYHDGVKGILILSREELQSGWSQNEVQSLDCEEMIIYEIMHS